MRRLSSYPAWFFSVLLLCFGVLTASGFVLVPTLMEMRLELEPPFSIEPDTRLIAAALHTGAAFVFLYILGALAAIHIRVGWRRHLNRISGLSLLLSSVLLLISALGMFYLGDEDGSRWASVIHTVTGLILVLLFAWHAEKGRRIRSTAR